MNEAKVSLTVKVRTAAGYDLLLTLREDVTEDEASALLNRWTALEKKLVERRWLPGDKAANKAGNSDVPDTVICETHQVPMKLKSGPNGQWYSHRTDEGTWCHGSKEQSKRLKASLTK